MSDKPDTPTFTQAEIDNILTLEELDLLALQVGDAITPQDIAEALDYWDAMATSKWVGALDAPPYREGDR